LTELRVKLLAFDTSTELLSIALCAGPGTPVREHGGAGGAQASAALIPAIQALLAQAGLQLADLDAIAFGRGPGSFTGLRTACAVAQGLGFGSGVPVLPIDTLLAVAEDAHGRSGATQVVAVLDARMGEVYAAAYQREAGGWRNVQAPTLLRPQELAIAPGWTLAGNALDQFGDRVPVGPRVAAVPSAAALLRLAPAALARAGGHAAAQALPLYIRDKVAQTTEERAADRARKESDRGARPEATR
jgi:tRNA threonylcarbamoyladenosine biosynthesis protein TsaB